MSLLSFEILYPSYQWPGLGRSKQSKQRDKQWKKQTTKNKTNSGSIIKGAVTLRNFLSNLSRNAVVKQVARELHSVTGFVLQCFLMCNVEHSIARSRTQVYFPQFTAATCSAIAQCITPPATFLAIFEPHSLQTRAQIYFALKRSGYEVFSAYLGQKYWKLLRTIAQCNRVQQLVSQWRCETSCWENCTV